MDRLTEPGKGRYDSPLRRAQAQATREAIAAAARRSFAERGWAATRVRDVAREAGVAEPTVYAVYRNKAGLARAVLDAVEAAADLAGAVEELQDVSDPANQLAILVGFDRRLFERDGDVITAMRDGGRSEPELRVSYREGRSHSDAGCRRVFSSWPPGTLCAGTDIDAACDTYAALCNVDVYRVLTEERGRTPDEVEDWWNRTLRRLLLP